MAPEQPPAASPFPAAEPFAPPPGLGTPEEEAAGPAGGGGVFVASMSTEEATAGMLQLPDELRTPESTKPEKKKRGIGSTIVTVLLVSIILFAIGVVVAIVGFKWQPPFLG
ncbi:MAG: hypothetical protein JKY65_26485 [Planctomycetes bacterium]|nr:hypothetical protein [Planctomycetota bacterium]